MEANGEEVESCFVKLIDEQTFETTSTFPLGQYENGCSVISCTFTDDSNSYYVVGTAYALPSEAEPSRGRLLVLSVQDNNLKLVAELETKGAVYSLASFSGKLLAGVNSKVQLYKWDETEEGVRQLTAECGHHGHILALFVVSRGDFIIVGDLMRSISLLLYKPVEQSIEEIARDYNPNWMTSVEALDDDTYIGAENSYNLFTVAKNAGAATDEERTRLDTMGQYHIGEFINKFRHGSLVMKLPDVTSEEADIPTLIYGTVSGSVGVIATLTQENYAFFKKVQDNLTKVIKGVGGLTHNDWRSFSNERKTSEARNFLDGDLIESFLDLKPEKMQEVVKGLDVSVEELSKRIETLQQALH
jgi:DNA damage-binding protein 1